jgi:hypothetical protein
MRFFTLILLLLLLTSCKDDNSVPLVEVQPSPPNLEITNHTPRAVFFYAIEQETSERVRLADPCQNFEPNLPADTTIMLPYEDIMGFNEEAEYVWFWWTDCVNNSDMETYPLYPN